MAATIMFYRAMGSERSPEYFGAVPNKPPHVLHYQVQSKEDGSLDCRHGVIKDLSLEQFYHLNQTHPPLEPRPSEQLEFLNLLRAFILPPLALL